MRILVTGGAGYIGSHACKALATAGLEPVTFDNLSTGHREAVKWGPLVEGDVRDPAALAAAFAAHRPDLVMHFAALAYVGVSVREPATYYETNVVGTLRLLEATVKAGVQGIVFSSTCAIYGQPDEVPIVETAAKRPMSPYGHSKLMAEQLLADFEVAYGLRWAALRYFNAAGADPDGEIGEDHDPETHAIPLALQSALGLRGAFEIFGIDYPTPDGSAVRDYIHVADLADAHVQAARRLAGGGASVALNLATGVGVSVRQIVDAAGKAAGRPVPVVEAPRRPGDPAGLYATGGKAREVLGWTPRFTDIDETVATAARWMTRDR